MGKCIVSIKVIKCESIFANRYISFTPNILIPLIQTMLLDFT